MIHRFGYFSRPSLPSNVCAAGAQLQRLEPSSWLAPMRSGKRRVACRVRGRAHLHELEGSTRMCTHGARTAGRPRAFSDTEGLPQWNTAVLSAPQALGYSPTAQEGGRLG